MGLSVPGARPGLRVCDVGSADHLGRPRKDATDALVSPWLAVVLETQVVRIGPPVPFGAPVFPVRFLACQVLAGLAGWLRVVEAIPVLPAVVDAHADSLIRQIAASPQKDLRAVSDG